MRKKEFAMTTWLIEEHFIGVIPVTVISTSLRTVIVNAMKQSVWYCPVSGRKQYTL